MTAQERAIAKHDKERERQSKARMTQEERLKKYFNTVLKKGETEAEKRIRILPVLDEDLDIFTEVYFHEMWVDGNKNKIYDPKQEGKRSPLNEVYEELMKTGEEKDKELAKQYRSRMFYIVKVIDRDNEQDGPKFWRFKAKYKGDGIYDKIFPFLRKSDITSPTTGRDLTLILKLIKSPNGMEYTDITTVMQEDPSPLHENQAIADAWMSDQTTWVDVYPKKSEDYLEMVANGETPKWDSLTSKWVSKGKAEETISSVAAPSGSLIMGEKSSPLIEQSGDDDLPF